jgi:hypothetical protein
MILDIIKAGVGVVGKLIGGDAAAAAEKLVGQITNSSVTELQLKEAMWEHEAKLMNIYAKDAEGARQLIREESKSEDAFVRRARPAFMWLFYAVIVFNFIIFPAVLIWKPDWVIEYPTMPEELYYLFGTAFVGYSGFRSWDKKNKANGTGPGR